MKVKVNGLAEAVELELQGYSDEIKSELAEHFKRIAAKCVKKLKDASPKRTGAYKKGWTRTIEATPETVKATVYNKKYGFLTHILENGHALKGGGRTSGTPHIGPVQDWADDEVLDAVAEILEGS